jgi:ABC transporter with metal-binding/Fe-S-binding domain ATP-binding protein
MLAALYSGGKDSTLAIHKMHDSGRKVELLITMLSENDYSYMLQKVNVEYTKLQAESMGIKHVFFGTKGEKEKELVDIEKALKENKVTEIVTGAVASRYQGDRINVICRKLGIQHHAPLWGMDPKAELSEISKSMNAIVTRVSAEGLDSSLLGKRIDGGMIAMLETANSKRGINLSFEGGEAESFVLDAPLFKKPVKILKSHVKLTGSTGDFIIDNAVLGSR